MKKRIVMLCSSLCLLLIPAYGVRAEEVVEDAVAEGTESLTEDVMISAPSAILMEASTGTIILEKNAKEKLAPASVTKIMTLLLIFEALDEGKIQLEDVVTVSAHAASMGGSQVFLEEGEQQTVETMIKCIAVASANDASTAMAEFVGGSEEAFVASMNERARELGMEDTNFVNCCGLDIEGHVTTAYDIALMSRELSVKHPEIHKYSTIWMENITHVTKRGSEEFGLTNTNKLISQYPDATGLKTGSTSVAKYCVSATATRDDLDLIAVIMAAPDYLVRFKDAMALLEYGFATCTLYNDTKELPRFVQDVSYGVETEVEGVCEEGFQYLSTTGENLAQVERSIVYEENLEAPIEKGKEIGSIYYKIGEREIGKVPIRAKTEIKLAKYPEYLKRTLQEFLL